MITSTSSSQVKHVVNLQKKAKLRKEEKQFVVEGVKMVSEAPADRLVKVYVSETFKADNEEFLERMNYDSIGKDVLEIVTDNVFMRMADTQTPQGIMAVVRMTDTDLEGILSDKHNPLLLIIENLQDPGNLGTIVRMAEGAGVTGIIMSSNTVDIYNPKTIRSTMGSLYRVPVIYVHDICEAADVCKSKGVTVYAA
ncbi:MAG: RNA methyltransferase, partial [Lachnospira sp.]|nr:RNA methyltransferase [Lachnospira sp.]